MKVNMILVVYKTSNASKQPKRLKKNLEKKNHVISTIGYIRNSQWPALQLASD